MGRFSVFVPAVSLLLFSGCKNDDIKCERARLDLNKSWSELRMTATHRKLDGVDTPGWADVENKAELAESSFMTSQVTWDSADKAGQAIQAALPSLHTDRAAELASFRSSTESTLKDQSDFEKKCR